MNLMELHVQILLSLIRRNLQYQYIPPFFQDKVRSKSFPFLALKPRGARLFWPMENRYFLSQLTTWPFKRFGFRWCSWLCHRRRRWCRWDRSNRRLRYIAIHWTPCAMERFEFFQSSISQCLGIRFWLSVQSQSTLCTHRRQLRRSRGNSWYT